MLIRGTARLGFGLCRVLMVRVREGCGYSYGNTHCHYPGYSYGGIFTAMATAVGCCYGYSYV